MTTTTDDLNWAAFYSVPDCEPVPFAPVPKSRRWRPGRSRRRRYSIPLLARPIRRSARWRPQR